MAGTVHRYRAEVAWQGSTGVGYERYDRAHHAGVPDGAAVQLSGDRAFGGDPALLNPEQLLVAASSCQLLSLLAVAARARIDVVAYRDDAVADMPEDDPPMRLTRIVLRPQITVRSGAQEVSDERLSHLVEVAHRECFIANSLRTEVVVEPAFRREPSHPIAP